MTPYDIITVPDPVLKTVAQPVARVDDRIRKQMDRMLETMYDAPGIGLAANQVGLLNRVIVCDVPEGVWEYDGEEAGILHIRSRRGESEGGEKPNPLAMANPEIVWRSEQKSVYEEGCLSIPEQFAEIVRPAHVKVRYLDMEGAEKIIEAQGLFSHCLQHEIDHLNGVLFIDYLSKLKRDMMLRKVEKMKKSQDVM